MVGPVRAPHDPRAELAGAEQLALRLLVHAIRSLPHNRHTVAGVAATRLVDRLGEAHERVWYARHVPESMRRDTLREALQAVLFARAALGLARQSRRAERDDGVLAELASGLEALRRRLCS
jgi:hypothetical protein